MKALDAICLTLVIIGAINWGLIGIFNFDLVSAIFGGSLYWISRVIYALVGVAGLYSLTYYGRLHREDHQSTTH